MRVRFLVCLLPVLFFFIGTNDQAQPQDASRAIVQVFDKYSIVMFGEVHEK